MEVQHIYPGIIQQALFRNKQTSIQLNSIQYCVSCEIKISFSYPLNLSIQIITWHFLVCIDINIVIIKYLESLFSKYSKLCTGKFETIDFLRIIKINTALVQGNIKLLLPFMIVQKFSFPVFFFGWRGCWWSRWQGFYKRK